MCPCANVWCAWIITNNCAIDSLLCMVWCNETASRLVEVIYSLIILTCWDWLYWRGWDHRITIEKCPAEAACLSIHRKFDFIDFYGLNLLCWQLPFLRDIPERIRATFSAEVSLKPKQISKSSSVEIYVSLSNFYLMTHFTVATQGWNTILCSRGGSLTFWEQAFLSAPPADFLSAPQAQTIKMNSFWFFQIIAHSSEPASSLMVVQKVRAWASCDSVLDNRKDDFLCRDMWRHACLLRRAVACSVFLVEGTPIGLLHVSSLKKFCSISL